MSKMNRAMRRQAERESGQTKILSVSKSLREDRDQKMCTRDEALEIAKKQCSYIMAAMLHALRDEHGFGKDRLQRVVDRANIKMDCILKGTVTEVELFDELVKLGVTNL